MTPTEIWYGRKPNLSRFRIFGSEFYVLVPKQLWRKLDARGLLCYFVGFSDTTTGDRHWDAATGKVNVSLDVTPVHHIYEPRFPPLDLQQGVDVFPIDEYEMSPENVISDRRLGSSCSRSGGIRRRGASRRISFAHFPAHYSTSSIRSLSFSTYSSHASLGTTSSISD